MSRRKSSARIVLRANPDGSLVRLSDVARLELGAQDYNIQGRFNGKPSAILALYQLPGTNALEAADGAKKVMAKLKDSFPATSIMKSHWTRRFPSPKG